MAVMKLCVGCSTFWGCLLEKCREEGQEETCFYYLKSSSGDN